MVSMGKRTKSQSFLQRAVGGFCAASFALVLPFICWGAAATPGHPHALPHFVFAAPRMATDADHTSMQSRPIRDILQELARSSWCSPGASQPSVGSAIDGSAPADAPATAGQSTPATLFAMLLVLPGIWLLRTALRRDFVRWFAVLETLAVAPLVPVPPPRLAA